MLKTCMIAGAVALSTALPVTAQEMNIGKAEFMNSCAACHGVDGKGGGVMANYLNTPLPDLTQLQKNNGGVFPVTRIYELIDGSSAMGPHGTREMPAWGNRYRADADDQLAMDYSPINRDVYVRSRILALVEYISTLQEE